MDKETADKSVSKSRKGLILAIVAVLIIGIALVGVLYTMDVWPFAADTAATTPGSSAPVASWPTSTPEPTPEATETVSLPSATAQEVMYWEQVASAEQINSLVKNEIASFTFTSVDVAADSATVDVAAVYRDGTKLNGTLILMKVDGAWYLQSITRDGNSALTPNAGVADAAIARTIAEHQAANQEIPEAIVDGTITGMTVNSVKSGSGTATISVTFTGAGSPVDGEITCISDADGTWFITEFANS